MFHLTENNLAKGLKCLSLKRLYKDMFIYNSYNSITGKAIHVIRWYLIEYKAFLIEHVAWLYYFVIFVFMFVFGN